LTELRKHFREEVFTKMLMWVLSNKANKNFFRKW
jgi:hypothetical protein